MNSNSTADDHDIDTIRRNNASFGGIEKRIGEYEESHPVPPRGGKMEIKQNRDFVSPLPDEKELDLMINS